MKLKYLGLSSHRTVLKTRFVVEIYLYFCYEGACQFINFAKTLLCFHTKYKLKIDFFVAWTRHYDPFCPSVSRIVNDTLLF